MKMPRKPRKKVCWPTLAGASMLAGKTLLGEQTGVGAPGSEVLRFRNCAMRVESNDKFTAAHNSPPL